VISMVSLFGLVVLKREILSLFNIVKLCYLLSNYPPVFINHCGHKSVCVCVHARV
jgi:hypothetical protein